jgi:hypothetical protein
MWSKRRLSVFSRAFGRDQVEVGHGHTTTDVVSLDSRRAAYIRFNITSTDLVGDGHADVPSESSRFFSHRNFSSGVTTVVNSSRDEMLAAEVSITLLAGTERTPGYDGCALYTNQGRETCR